MTTPPNNPWAGYFLPPGPADTASLSANRVGELAPDQKKQMQGRLLPRLAGSVFGAIIFVPFLFCFGGTLLGSINEGEGGVELIPFGIMLTVFGGIALVAVIGGAKPALALVDIAAGRVEQADGRLAWRGNEYRGVTEGRTLTLLSGVELMPGGYRFYYLPRSGYIASAERLFLGGTEADAQAELRRALQDVFNFTDDDLPENQAGRLSARQVTAQVWAAVRSGLVLSPFLLMALFFAVGQRGHQALIQGRRYRLYFFPRSKRVVSVEPLFT